MALETLRHNAITLAVYVSMTEMSLTLRSSEMQNVEMNAYPISA